MVPSSLHSVLRYARRLAESGQGEQPSDSTLLQQFSAQHCDHAFARLVERHGALVWGVCRRVLPGAQDAEDCFQATFLVLARKADTLRNCDSLAAWLHRVAYRLALRAHSTGVRRQQEERRAGSMTRTTSQTEESWSEVRRVLDQELEQLPEVYRAALVLCYLEGVSHVEAARSLGCPLGTVKGRLARGRALLRKGLEKRGLTLTAAGLAALLVDNAATAAFPSKLMIPALDVARAFALGKSASLTGRAIVLANDFLRTTAMAGLVKSALAVALLTLTVSGGAIVAGPDWGNEQDRNQAAEEANLLPTREDRNGHVDTNGDPLPPDAIARLGAMRFNPGVPIQALQITADGSTILSRGHDGISRWDLRTGKQIHWNAWDRTRVPDAVSRDGKLSVTLLDEGGIEVHDIGTGAKVAGFGNGPYNGAFLSPDSRYVAALSFNGPELYEISSGIMRWKTEPYQLPLATGCFTNDGKSVILAGWGMQRIPPLPANSIRILDAVSGKERMALDLAIDAPQTVAVSSNNSLLAAICRVRDDKGDGVANEIRAWELGSGRERLQVRAPLPASKITGRRSFAALLFTPDSKSLITAGSGDQLVEWNLATGKEKRRLGHDLGDSTALAMSSDGKTLAAGMNTITVLDFESGNKLQPTTSYIPGGMATGFSSPDGFFMTAGPIKDDGRTRISYWDLATAKSPREAVAVDGYVRGFAAHGTTALVQSAGRAKSAELSLRNLPKETSRPLPAKVAGNWSAPLALSSTGKLVGVFDAESKSIKVFDTDSAAILQSFGDLIAGVRHLQFAGDDKTLFAFSPDQTVSIWNLSDGKKVGQYLPTKVPDTRLQPLAPPLAVPREPPFEVALSPDGKTIALCEYRDYILFFDAADGGNVRRVDVGSETARVLAFSPDGKLLLWSSMYDPSVHLIDVARCKEVRRLAGHRGVVTSMTFSPDGQRLVTRNTDGTALVWDFARIQKSLK
jgi:RNA polymerase sigma factor (sigma-70 family)